MKDCEKILNEMYWRMKVMVEEKEKERGDLDEYGLNDEVWEFYGYGVFEELMEEWYYENDLGVGCGEKWGRDYREVLLDFIEFIGMSVLWNREIEIVLVGKWWMEISGMQSFYHKHIPLATARILTSPSTQIEAMAFSRKCLFNDATF